MSIGIDHGLSIFIRLPISTQRRRIRQQLMKLDKWQLTTIEGYLRRLKIKKNNIIKE